MNECTKIDKYHMCVNTSGVQDQGIKVCVFLIV